MAQENEIKSEMPAVDRNIEAIHRIRKNSDDLRRADQKIIDLVASFIGSSKSIYLHIIFYGVWFVFLAFGFDGETKNNLELTATLEAIFLTLFVLINQRRMDAVERKSGDLHLQTSLLAEHELTKIAQVLDRIAKKVLPFDLSNSLEDVKKDIHPDVILSKIAKHEESVPTSLTLDKK